MRHAITSNGFPTVTISKMNTGDKIYAERSAEHDSYIASSEIFIQEDADAGRPTGYLKRKLLTAAELGGVDYTPEVKPTPLSRWWAAAKKDIEQTIDRQNVGEHTYVLYEALAPNQKVTFTSCFPGTIMCWDATPLADGESYLEAGDDALSVKDNGPKPHGTLVCVNGSFLVADFHVRTKVYHTGKVDIVDFSETKDAFQKFSGPGNVYLEVHGDLIEVPLYPHEAINVMPGHLLGFTEGVELDIKEAGDLSLRSIENNPYVIKATAGEKGGYVYIHAVKIKDFFRRNPK